MAEERVGIVTHYFPKPEVGVVKLTAAIKLGDLLRFHGHSTEFQQQVVSMQVEHQPVETAAAGSEIAIKVAQRVRQGDEVYRVTPG
jgi:putative protease